MKEFFNKIKETAKKAWAFILSHKVVSIVVAAILVVGISVGGILLATGDKGTTNNGNTPGGEQSSSFVYRIKVVTANDFGLKDVKVTLLDGKKEVASATTSSAGYATFKEKDVANVGAYTIKLDNLPAGYKLANNNTYKTVALSGTEVSVPLVSGGIIQEEAPTGTYYALGNVMHDFSITLSDGSTFTLSETLKEKDMVLLNFWATWCGPCKSEFPAMNNAYIEYKDKVEILAVSTTDDKASVASYKGTAGLTFPMANDSINLQSKFNTAGIPYSVVIDRNGVISFAHTGAMTQKSDFTALFDKFIGNDYTPTILGSADDFIDPGVQGEDRVLPNVTAPEDNKVASALGTDNNFSFRWQKEDPSKHDPYNWPWLVSEDGTYIYTPTSTVNSSYAILYIDFTAQAGQALCFDYILNSEAQSAAYGDIFYVFIDETPIHQLSGVTANDWTTCVAYVFDEYEAGDHTLTFLYNKDGDTSVGDDIVKIKNLGFKTVSSLNTPNVNSNVFQYAANGLNETGAKTQFSRYITPVYNSADGYYHVNSKTGPLLFACMMYSTPWNEYGIWTLAASGYCAVDGANYANFVESYAWEATQNMINYGYTPVTQDLKDLLDVLTANVTYGKKWTGSWHANEWLELCAYYEHYGDTPAMEDPMKTITFHAAEKLEEGTNTVNVPFAMTPRGFKYKFTAAKSGVYNVYSTGDKDTVCFLIADDRETMLGEYDDLAGASTIVDENGVEIVDGNFNFHYYMQAGKTYYLLFTTFLDQPGSYEVEIEYKGQSFEVLDNCATGPLSFNEVTGEVYLPDAIDFKYNEADGYYHVVNKDGSLGSIIYLDCNRPTAFFQSNALYDIARDAQNYPPEKRAFYVTYTDENGATQTKDLTEDIMRICFNANKNTENKGFIAVDEEVYKILNYLIRSDKYEGIENDWLRLCYYYKTISANNVK